MAVRVGRQRAASAIFLLERQVPQLGADSLGGGVDEAVQLVGGSGACLHRPCSSHAQLTQRLDGTGAGLRGHGRITRQHRPRGGFGVDGVGLPAPATVLSVGSVHLHHPHAPSSEIAGQPRPPRPTTLDPNRDELPEAAQPCQQALVAVACRRQTQPCPGSDRGRRSPPRRGRLCGCRLRRGPCVCPRTARSWSCHSFHQTGLDGTHRRAGGQDSDRALLHRRLFGHVRPTGACDAQGPAHPADWSHPRHQQGPADMRVRPSEHDPARRYGAPGDSHLVTFCARVRCTG